jgi:peptide/nickel transport system substrate-binding protein
MLRKHHRLCLAAALLALACLSVGSSGAAARGTASSKPVLRMGLGAPPDTLNPALTAGGNYTEPFYDAPLLHMQTNGKIVGDLATSWHYYNGGRGPHKDFELTLRHDARFSDGEQVDASAVAKWLTYFKKAKGNSSGFFGPSAKFVAHGKWTVQIHTATPVPGIPQLLTELYHWGSVQAPKAVDKPSLFSKGSWGAGPYMVDPAQTINGDHYTLVPNPYYRGKFGAKWSKVTLKVFANPSTMLSAIRSGQIDEGDGDPTTAAAAKAAGFDIVTAPYETIMLYISDFQGTVSKPMGDARVRQAMNYAVDRATIAKTLFNGYATPTSVLLVSDASAPANYYPYNPAKAKALLQAAGYGNGFTVNTHVFAPMGQFGIPLFQAAASYLAKVGITMKIKSDATGGEWVAENNSKTFPLYFTGYPIVPTTIMTPTYLLPPKNNFGQYDATVKKLYYQGLNAANPMPSWKKMWNRVAAQGYFFPIVLQNSIYYVSKHVGGVTTSQARDAQVVPTEWYPK